MKFKLIKPNCKDVPSYGGVKVSTGGVVELEGSLAEKAAKNPAYEHIEEQSNQKSGARK